MYYLLMLLLMQNFGGFSLNEGPEHYERALITTQPEIRKLRSNLRSPGCEFHIKKKMTHKPICTPSSLNRSRAAHALKQR